MNAKIITAVVAATLGMSLSAPAMAQRTMGQMAANLGTKANLAALGGKTEIAGRSAANVDARKDPWRPVTPAEMVAATKERRAFKTTAFVDYNGDGVTDKAYIVRNSRQGAVLVDLGGGKGTVLAYKANQPLIYGQQVYPAGKRRIMLEFPESHVAVLSQETGKQTVTYLGQ